MGGGARQTVARLSAATKVVVRDATRADLKAICAIERKSFTDPWSSAMFATHLGTPLLDSFIVVEDSDAGVLGYALARVIGESGELFNIAVQPERRGAGLGALLLDAAMVRCGALGATEVWLEVRESNAAARALYESRKFTAVGRRKRYYESPREDAILLRAELVGASRRNETVTRAGTGFPGCQTDSILSSASQLPRQEIK